MAQNWINRSPNVPLDNVSIEELTAWEALSSIASLDDLISYGEEEPSTPVRAAIPPTRSSSSNNFAIARGKVDHEESEEDSNAFREIRFNLCYLGDDRRGILAIIALTASEEEANIINVDATTRAKFGIIIAHLVAKLSPEQDEAEYIKHLQQCCRENIARFINYQREVHQSCFQSRETWEAEDDIPVHPSEVPLHLHRDVPDTTARHFVAHLSVENIPGVLAIILIMLFSLDIEIKDCTQRYSHSNRAELVLRLEPIAGKRRYQDANGVAIELEEKMEQFPVVHHVFVHPEKQETENTYFVRSWRDLTQGGTAV